MRLADFYFDDPRVDLIPIEHLTASGVDAEFADILQVRGWREAQTALLNRAFRIYWSRASELASRCASWPAPRLRHIAVIRDSAAVRPYAQILNTSSWSLYAADFDPSTASAELLAYLFVHGDRMAVSGEITLCSLHNAPYWFARSAEEIEDFDRGARCSTRPDARGFQVVADAIPWLRELYHDDLRPPHSPAACRRIPGSGILVPRDLEARPPELVRQWTDVASSVLGDFYARQRRAAPSTLQALLDWLSEARPPVLITGKRERVLWDPQHPDRLGTLRAELRQATEVGLRHVHADLRLTAAKTNLFFSSLRSPGDLPKPHADTLQSGYTYLHRDRGLLAYNLHDPAFERLTTPALPYGLAMLGARTIHEWCHLAVDAGWVPQTLDEAQKKHLVDAVAAQFDEIVDSASAGARQRCRRDMQKLMAMYPGSTTPGAALTALLLGRVSDYQGNLLAQRYLSIVERETYVRHNIRTLRGMYRAEEAWRMLVRYVTEMQYLGFSLVADAQTFLVASTWFEQDLIAPGFIDRERFAALDRCVKDLFASYAVLESKFFRPSSAQATTPR